MRRRIVPFRKPRIVRRGKASAQATVALVFGALAVVGVVTGNVSGPQADRPIDSNGTASTAQTVEASTIAGERRGRASVTDGDTIEIHGERIRIHGVDAPESAQTCQDAEGAAWRCGQSAALALSDLLDAQTVSCIRTDTDRYGRTVARCSVAGEDVGAWLVSNGWARAFTRYSSEYLGQEREAKLAKLGIWRGEHVAPWDWRAQQHAVSDTPPLSLMDAGSQPSACAIKGNINSRGECIYHVPGSRWYGRTKISPSKGEQYFCTVADAVAAGCRAPRG